MAYDSELREGRFTGSKLGCPRMMALAYQGVEAVISKKLQAAFDEGQEHDEVMKTEAQEEWGDNFKSPEPAMVVLSRGNVKAEVIITPDGLLPKELVEFKSLSSYNYNLLRTEEDLRNGSDLFRKYWDQVQFYAGAYGKRVIRFRVRNKTNRKTKDIVFKARLKEYKRIEKKILDVKELLDKGQLPPMGCQNPKWCMYGTSCKQIGIEKFENAKTKPLTKPLKSALELAAEYYYELGQRIKELTSERAVHRQTIAETFASHGQREIQLGKYLAKYGVRYKNLKNKEDIEKLVDEGKIRVEEVPEDYVTVEVIDEQ